MFTLHSISSWHYEHIKLHKNHGIRKVTHINLIFLKLELFLKDGQKGVIIEQLAPWAEIPENFDYKLPEQIYDFNWKVKKSIKKISSFENF